MKIERNIKYPFSKRDSNLFRRKKSIVTWIITITALIGLGALIFGILDYGAYMHQSGQMRYYKSTLVNLAKFDFSFIKNYGKGRLAEFDEIQLDVKFKHMLRIRYLREQALAVGIISKEAKDEEFPAKLTYKGKTYNVKIGLTGLLAASHLKDPTQWSLQVKVKGDETVRGVKRFGLLRPSTRGFLTDWIAMELLKEQGLMGLRVDFVTVTLNGQERGVFYFEERFDKHFIEYNRLREGILFKLDNNFSPYQESKLMAGQDTRDQLLMIKRMWQDVMAGTMAPGRFFDLEKMGKLFAIADLVNNKHPLSLQNMRFYFNPATGLAEPVAREFESIEKSDPSMLRLFIENPEPGTRHFQLMQDSILRMISSQPVFKYHYLQELHEVAKTDFLDSFFEKHEATINTLMNKVYRTWPFYELHTFKLYKNQEYIRSMLYPERPQLTAYFAGSNGNYLRLYLQNQQDLPLEVLHLKWRDSLKLYPEDNVVVTSKSKSLPGFADFRLPEGLTLNESNLSELKLDFQILGLEDTRKSISIFSSGQKEMVAQSDAIQGAVEKYPPNYTSFDFIKEKEDGKTLWIPEGAWQISKNLVLPAGKRLEIEAGTKIDLINNAGIISYSPIYSLGTREKQVLIKSSDASGGGVVVIRAPQTSSLSHTVFDQLNRLPKEVAISGAVAFYESPVDIVSCTFSNNRKGEDAFLQIIRSEFSLDQSLFKNIKSDALAGDFSRGVITNSSFVNIEEDGIDAIASNLKVRHVFMSHIGGKGLSAGENSELEVRWIDIRNAATGITSKDRSRVNILDSQIYNSKIGITLFQEKSGFGPASIMAGRIKIQQSETPYLIEQNSSLLLDGNLLAANREKVNELTYQ